MVVTEVVHRRLYLTRKQSLRNKKETFNYINDGNECLCHFFPFYKCVTIHRLFIYSIRNHKKK